MNEGMKKGERKVFYHTMKDTTRPVILFQQLEIIKSYSVTVPNINLLHMLIASTSRHRTPALKYPVRSAKGQLISKQN